MYMRSEHANVPQGLKMIPRHKNNLRTLHLLARVETNQLIVGIRRKIIRRVFFFILDIRLSSELMVVQGEASLQSPRKIGCSMNHAVVTERGRH